MSAALWQAEADVSAALVALAKRHQEGVAKLAGGGRAAAAAAKKAAAAEGEVVQWLDSQEAELTGLMGHSVRCVCASCVCVFLNVYVVCVCVLQGWWLDSQEA